MSTPIPAQAVASSTVSSSATPPSVPVTLTYTVTNEFPHDVGAFTQGFVYLDGWFYETTGLYGRSSIRQVELQTGRINRIRRIEDNYFGEGLVILDERMIWITWKSETGFVYDLNTFDRIGEFHYPTEGWGLTSDGEVIFMSDGTSTIYLLDPQSLQQMGQISVLDDDKPVTNLNELEFIHGSIYANIWQTNTIVRIDPETGTVTGRLDLTGIQQRFSEFPRKTDVLNGIAYDAEHDRIFITGKLWPKVFEIEITE